MSVGIVPQERILVLHFTLFRFLHLVPFVLVQFSTALSPKTETVKSEFVKEK